MLLRFSVASADHPAPASCFVFPRGLESWSLANPLWLLNDIVSLVRIEGIMPGLPASLSFTISGIRESGKADSRSLSSGVCDHAVLAVYVLCKEEQKLRRTRIFEPFPVICLVNLFLVYVRYGCLVTTSKSISSHAMLQRLEHFISSTFCISEAPFRCPLLCLI